MGNELRTSAQARIAASAPKITYGKHKNKLLPLTGSQFLRNDVFGTAEKRILAKDFIQRTDQQSSADESPLSDAEPAGKKRSKRQVVARTGQPRAYTKAASVVKPTRHEAGDVPSAYPDTEEDGERSSDSPLPRRDQPVVDRHGSRRSAPSAPTKGRLKPAAVIRGRLPLNELLLVSGARNDDVFNNPNKNHGTLLKDPISSSAQPLIDAVSSGHSETTPAKRKAKAPRSAIRKRLRTPSSAYKSLENLRRKHNAAQFTPSGSQARQIVGDGFESAELTPNHPFRYTVKHERRQHEPLLAGLKALTLASGPLPEVVFLDESNPTQLKLAKDDTSDHNENALGYVAPATIVPPNGMSNSSSNQRVSFNYDVERAILAQLASVSAPRRQPSIALGSEDEAEEDGDDGDEAGDEEEDDDEAADTYLDQDELPPEEHHMNVDEIREIQTSLPSARSQPESPAPELGHRVQCGWRTMAPVSNGFVADASRQRTPNFRRRTFSGRPLLNEVNEPIVDDFQVDDMLLGDEEGEDLNAMRGSVEYITANINRNLHGITGVEIPMQSPSGELQGKQAVFGRTSSMQPRSILKNGTPHISSDSNRPESTAANTRRNSMVDVEESRYLSAAKDQLDSTSTKHTIIRKKSSSRFFEPIEVPYGDEMVLETSPKKPDYTNRSQLHLFKHTNKALWTSSAAPVPQADLRTLTRSVSKDNGTLSQSVRRRSSLKFQSPRKLV
ncbi:hypothetical protein Q7P35_011033 [Cladosporium inversicolor]